MNWTLATEHVNSDNKLSLCIDSVMFVLFSVVSCTVPFSVDHTPVVMVCAESAAAGSEVISVVFG